jgi:phosphoribosylanthranilate isomerase
VKAIQPWGVDVASGVEPDDQPGIKDIAKVKAFIANVRGATSA